MYGLGTSLNYPSIDQAITKFETGGNPTSVGMRNNNPGNLVYSSWMQQFGCGPGGAGGFAQCPTLDAGNQILDYRVSQLVTKGDSVSDLISTWAGPQYSGNSQESYNNYVESVASDTGLDPSLPIAAQFTSNVPDSASDILSPETFIPTTSPNWTLVGLAAGAGLLLLWAAA